MGDVYSTARSVTAWLNDGGNRSFRNYMGIFISLFPTDEKIQADRMEFELQLVAPVSTCVYWTRLWVIQELVLAKTIVIQIGRYRLPWDSLVRVMQSLLDRELSDLSLWMKNEILPTL